MLDRAYARCLTLVARVRNIHVREDGASAVEYGLLLVLIAAVIIAVVSIVGEKTSNAFESFNAQLP